MTKGIMAIAEEHDLNPYMLAAVANVESGGRSGFRNYPGAPNHPVIRFEPHHFNKRCSPENTMPFTNNGRGFSSLKSETGWEAFLLAYRLDEGAAIQSTSWGMFQIMGFHYRKLKFKTPQEFRKAMFSAEGQYTVFARFIQSHKILREAASCMTPDETVFRRFAKSYNGASNVDEYSKRITNAYAREVTE